MHASERKILDLSKWPRLVRRLGRARVQPVETGGKPEFQIQDEKGDVPMRVMVIVKASKDSEAGVLPSQKLLAEMGKYNEELVKAGIMLAGEGLQASSKGVRVRFSGAKRTVIDGPFTEAKELIAGCWLWQVRSVEEDFEWLKRCPNAHNEETEVEIRRVFEAADFGPEFREQEERLRAQSEQLSKAAKK